MDMPFSLTPFPFLFRDLQILKYPPFRAHAMRPYKCTVVFGIIYFLVFSYQGIMGQKFEELVRKF
jgi:hypothetical protein